MNIVHVNLSSGKIRIQKGECALVKKYVGGRGWGAYYLNQQLPFPKSVDPFAPENPLLINPGLLAGTPVPSASRCTFTAKSPLTGAYGYSNVGGHFGAELRMAGIASVVIVGKADHPVYLSITDDISLEDAGHLWGKNTWETEDSIRKEMGETQICSIGRAGENLVRFASLIHDKSRAAGRCGMGAIMGSKLLKAVVVRGEKGTPVSDVESLEKTFFKVTEALQSSWFYPIFSRYGSSSGMLASQVMGLFPTKHYQEGGSYDNIDTVTGETLYDSYVTGNLSCSSCTLHCDRVFSVDVSSPKGSGCEHYHLSNLGVNLTISDLGFILRMVNQLNDVGMDVGDACETISWLIECYEKGVISREEIGFTPLWGDNQTVELLIDLIARREGIGNILAEGSAVASQRLGGKEYLTTVKGMSFPANDPRGDPVWGLGFAVGVRGADHLSFMSVIHRIQDRALARNIYGDETFSEYKKIEGKGFLVKIDEDSMAAIDSLGICKWNYTSLSYTYTLDLMAELAEAVTGLPFDKKTLLICGERIYNTEKVFNMKMGLTRADDTLPQRFTTEPLKSGLMKGCVVPLEPMLDEYYRARKWDIKTGLPSQEFLLSLGVEA